MRLATWTPSRRDWARAVAVLVGLAVLACVLVSHSPAATASTTSPAQAMPAMATTSTVMPSADAVADPVLGGGAATVGLAGAVMDRGGMSGSGAAHVCLAAVSVPVLVALAVVLAVVASGWVRRGSPVFGPTAYVVARGAPPWTVLSRAQLSVIRI